MRAALLAARRPPYCSRGGARRTRAARSARRIGPRRVRPRRRVPCPTRAGADGVPAAPARRRPPAVPEQPAVGGEALATAGLVVPAGAPRAAGGHRDLVAGRRPGHRRGARRLRPARVRHPGQRAEAAAGRHRAAASSTRSRWSPSPHADLDIEPGSSAVGLVEGGRYTGRDALARAAAQLRQRRRQRAGPARRRDGRRPAGGRGDERRGAPARRAPDPRGDPVRAGRPGPVHQRVRPGADRPGLLRRADLPPVRADRARPRSRPSRR